ncbi:hypothetical protein GCM10007063_26910 [Lentibacillus kapialis]|uniref:Uncharacterized protein n=1 Tax=Lentibacillus kapialis TaxID=340214 RepID=A0A917PZS5_9BACI|nr:hypothetical protein [Lentibacillus kapialis]GGK03325.1 hypothetical protein GCM10007063_26910 [Lentibacillus kapialis]
MNKRLLFLSVVFLVCTSLLTLFWRMGAIPVITYFPEDNQTGFVKTGTALELISENSSDSYEMIWTSTSKSEENLYLRQDASLIFNNGQLIGVRSNWRKNTDTIRIEEKFSAEDSNYFQAISFHHGEVHYPNKIKSIHHSTYDQLYVIDSPSTILKSFKSPETGYEHEWARLLNHTTEQQLVYNWKQLMAYYDIDQKDYYAIPLTDLHKFNTEPLPSFTQKQTKQIIGQLWEGIYKNYILNVKNLRNKTVKSYIPLILFDNQHNHLMVLFEWNGQKERLIQKYPDF